MTGKQSSKETAPASYVVGYGKPPAHAQFKKGQSGNSKGRPKGSKNVKPIGEERLSSIILEEAYREIPLTEAGGRINMPMVKAVVRSMGVTAVKGKVHAQKQFTTLVSEVETRQREERDNLLKEALKYKIYWDDELARRKRLNIDLPEPLPHPDDIHINLVTSEVVVNGPMLEGELREVDRYLDIVRASEKEIADIELELITETDASKREGLLWFLEEEKRHVELVQRLIPTRLLSKGKVPKFEPSMDTATSVAT